MDGGHRIANAWVAKATEIAAVRFVIDPEPDDLLEEGEATPRPTFCG